MFRKTRLLLVTLWLSGSAFAQTTGTISGVVVDENGQPLPKALVRIAETKPFYGSRVLDFYETDKDGRFLIEHVPWGTYAVMAKKEDSGYADMGFAFESNLAVPIVMLAPAFPKLDITVPLGPKAGKLDLVSLTDAETGKDLLESGAITLRRVQNPKFFMTTSTKTLRPFFVPANTDVSIEIAARGYKAWPGPDQAEQGRIRLKPEEILKLEIKLQPDPATSESSAPQ
jgi:Carboxypeptidase regulatory-like domain